ncbi:MAG TPA: response regulator [Candidatus Omnitrophota bacterium]|nr:response regulator [Candidatus Omnitrophota bacterium]
MKKVLIADDDYITAEMFKEAIENLGHDVVAVAHNSEEAINRAFELRPDVAFLDIKMDYRIAGIHASNLIKDRYPDIKVYFLTAYAKDVFHAELAHAQYDGYIDKLQFMDIVDKILK